MSTISFNHPLSSLPAQKRIALVAHDGKKSALCEWVGMWKTQLSKHALFATGTTGSMIQSKLGLSVTTFASGPLGGDLQLGAMIVDEKIDMLIFFWDPLTAQPHDPDVKALLRIAALYEIPIACNRASADFLLTSSLVGDVYNRTFAS